MSITYSLAPIPKWYIADLTGKPLGGGSMYTYRSLDKTQFKFVFQDPSGLFPWTDPVLFDENGSQGPFYWEVDSLNPQETYYIEVYDAQGVLQWTIDNFAPSGSGGSVITTATNLKNLIVNNVFWRNVGTVGPSLTTSQFLAPSAHSALTYSVDIAGGITCAPDIYFFKNNTNATDTISFPAFTLGSNALVGDVTPTNYMNYTCTNSPSGETFKFVQYPITPGVQNLTNQDTKLTIWARGNSGTTTLLLQWMQFFGEGTGASTPVTTPIQTLTLTSGWQKFTVSAPVPDVSGKSIGLCGNSALFLQIGFPLGAACNIDLVKPCLYLGNLSPDEEYSTTDETDSVINSPRIGNIKITSNNIWEDTLGWVDMNDGSIGSSTSNATTRANIDTYPLFKALWDSTTNTNCPVQDSTGTPVARGASAAEDFGANNRRLVLPQVLGRALSSFGLASSGATTNWVMAQTTGEENHVLTVSELASHTHAGDGAFFEAGAGNSYNSVGGAQFATHANTLPTGSNAGHNTMQPTVFFRVLMKL